MSESRRVAITGGNGVVGSALSSSYLKNEYDVVALDDPDIDILAEPEKFRRALKGVDTVIHLARSTGEGDHREMWRTPHRNPVNAELFHAALQGAEHAGAKKFIDASSIHVEDTMEFSALSSDLLTPEPGVFMTETKSGYGQGKREQELRLAERARRFERGAVSIRLGGVTSHNEPLKEHDDPRVVAHEKRVWLEHGDLANLVGRIIEFEDYTADHDIVYAVSNNDGRFHSTQNQYGWSPAANSQNYVVKQPEF